MNRIDSSTHSRIPPGSPPDLKQLFARFLQQRASRLASGLDDLAGPPEEVEPHQAAAAAAVEPRIALGEAVQAAEYCLGRSQAEVFVIAGLKLPDWAALVKMQEPMFAIPLALGNYPQALRDILPLLGGVKLSELRPKAAPPLALEALEQWGARKASASDHAAALLAAGALRLARRFDDAEVLLTRIKGNAAASWAGLIANEEAALAWHRGDADTADRLWHQHSTTESPAVIFNRGMAALFQERKADAARLLEQAVRALPESSGWHHLGQFYLTIAVS
jgi:tetratricopeptide (TPR) repeat protein